MLQWRISLILAIPRSIRIKSYIYPSLKYGLVGSISACIYFSAIWMLYTNLNYHYLFSIGLAYFLCNIFHFFANKKFTFKNSKDISFELVYKYIFLIIINNLFTLLIVLFTKEYLYISPYFGALISIGITFMIGYLVSSKFIFS